MEIVSLVIGILSLIVGVPSLIISYLSFRTMQKVDKEVRRASSITLLRTRSLQFLPEIQKAIAALKQAEYGRDVKSAFSGAIPGVCCFMQSELADAQTKDWYQDISSKISSYDAEPTSTNIYESVTDCIAFLSFIETKIMTEG